MHSEPVTTSLPAGASPRTSSACAPEGSLVVTVIFAVLPPKLVGAKRIGRGSVAPGATDKGSESTCGTRKSDDDELTPVINSEQYPLLLTSSGSSANEPTHTLPKLPASAMARAAVGPAASPETGTLCGPVGSSLRTAIVPNLVPSVPGWKRMTTSIESPGCRVIGKDATLGVRKSGDDETMLVMLSSSL